MIVMLVLYGYLRLLFLPVFNDISKNKSSINTYNQEINTQNSNKAINMKNKKELEDLKGKMGDVFASLPEDERNPEVAYDLKGIADNSGVILNNINLGQTSGTIGASQNASTQNTDNGAVNINIPQNNTKLPQGADKVRVIPLSIQVTGTYGNITKYLSALEHGSRLMEIQNVSMSGNGKNIKASITVNCLYMDTQNKGGISYDFNKGTYGKDDPFN